MGKFQVTQDFMSVSNMQLADCLKSMTKDLIAVIESMNPNQAMLNRSISLKKHLIESVPKSSRIQLRKSSVFQNQRFIDAGAIFELDGTSNCDQACGTLHTLNIVLALNNRETIGTNFLKLEVSALEEIRYNKSANLYDENILGVLITFSRDILKRGNWDSAYADSTEYSFAYKNAYRKVLSSNQTSLQVHLL